MRGQWVEWVRTRLQPQERQALCAALPSDRITKPTIPRWRRDRRAFYIGHTMKYDHVGAGTDSTTRSGVWTDGSGGVRAAQNARAT